MNTMTEEEALKRVASYCAAAEHCRAEVSEKLQKWGIAYDAIERILARLESEDYINEERYCRAFVADKFRFAKWGKKKIGQGLYMKKVPTHVAWHFLNEIDQEEYLSVLRDLIASKRKGVRGNDEFEQNGKLIRFALSRGFEMKDIRCCIEVADEEAYEE